MDMGFAAICQFARTLPALHPVLVHRLASLLHAACSPPLTVRSLRFAVTSPPSGGEEDLHFSAVGLARRTKKQVLSVGRTRFFIFNGKLPQDDL